MTIKERYQGVLQTFQEIMPEATTELIYSNAYELLVAVMLSAQCTDKRVNTVTPALFKAFPTVHQLAKASIDDILYFIASISYPNSKAKHLQQMAQKVVCDFHGEIPSSREELMLLPGVGRKTANVMLIVYFGEPAMPVDTHVFRVSERIGLTRGAKNPDQSERQLLQHIPASYLAKAHHWLILHGRYVCKAQKPQCKTCPVDKYCKYYNKNIKKKIPYLYRTDKNREQKD